MVFSSLPNEILIVILAEAASSSLACALALARVSSWTRHIALVHIYHTVVITSARQLEGFSYTVTSSASPGHLVRRLWIYQEDSEAIAEIVGCCPRVESLALTAPRITNLVHYGAVLPLLRELIVVRDGIRIPVNTSKYTTSPALSKITHFQAWFSNSILIYPFLPHLTHLALAFTPALIPTENADVLGAMLHRRTSLVSVAIFTTPQEPFFSPKLYRQWEKVLREYDPRVQLVPLSVDSVSPMSDFYHWKPAARGEEDIWERAARFRKDGETDEFQWPLRSRSKLSG